MNIVIWPANIDAEKSRAKGRKIAAKKTVPSPTLKEIEKAAQKLGLNPKTGKQKAYSREPFEKTGKVTVDKKRPKTLILREIAKEIKKNRL